MTKENKNIEKQVKHLIILVGQLNNQLAKTKSDLDEHLLEHMIDDRNKEFDLNYPIEDD